MLSPLHPSVHPLVREISCSGRELVTCEPQDATFLLAPKNCATDRAVYAHDLVPLESVALILFRECWQHTKKEVLREMGSSVHLSNISSGYTLVFIQIKNSRSREPEAVFL